MHLSSGEEGLCGGGRGSARRGLNSHLPLCQGSTAPTTQGELGGQVSMPAPLHLMGPLPLSHSLWLMTPPPPLLSECQEALGPGLGLGLSPRR